MKHQMRIAVVTIISLALLASQQTTFSAAFTATGALKTGRFWHAAVLLPNGKVLVAGGRNGLTSLASAELYDSATGTWSYTGNLNQAREGATATLLANGKVLITGGQQVQSSLTLASCEIYDPATGLWTTVAPLQRNRLFHSEKILPNGEVLIVGGNGTVEVGLPASGTSAELFNPTSLTWRYAGPLAYNELFPTSYLLSNGKVLVAGGNNNPPEMYDPQTGQWSAAGTNNIYRGQAGVFMPNGSVLLTGGDISPLVAIVPTSTTSLYFPSNHTWIPSGNMVAPRALHRATLLPDGNVLVAGGHNGTTFINSAEIYNRTNGTWALTAFMNSSRGSVFSTTLLQNGKVLVTGGDISNTALASVEVYDAVPRVPTPVVLNNARVQTNQTFQFSFSATPNGTNTVWATTNSAVPRENWSSLGRVPEFQPGLYWFTDSQATNYARRFYQVRSP